MSNAETKPISIGALTIAVDNSQLRATLALLQQIESAAKSAAAALASIGAAPAPVGDFAVSEILPDDTQAMILAEMRSWRADQLRLLADLSDANYMAVKSTFGRG